MDASKTAWAINDILKLPQQDQGPLEEVIVAWLDLDERDASSDEDENECIYEDMDSTGIWHTINNNNNNKRYY